MKEFLYKSKKIISIFIIIIVSIYLYSNKPYSLYEINRIDKIDNIKVKENKYLY